MVMTHQVLIIYVQVKCNLKVPLSTNMKYSHFILTLSCELFIIKCLHHYYHHNMYYTHNRKI